MTELTIEAIRAGSILIDNFMGKSTFTYQFSNWKYHLSYEWSMPVVEKIEKLDGGIYLVNISKDRCQISYILPKRKEIDLDKYKDGVITSKISIEPGNKKEAIFLSIVSFLEWYNSQKE